MNVAKLLFILFASLQFLEAQQPSYFILGKEQFEGVEIYDVIQDKNQNYWFATDQGFYKYNSHAFEKIECEGMKGLSAFRFVINKAGTIFCHNLNYQILKIENNHCSVFYELSESERSSDMSLFISEENNLVVIGKIPFIFDQKGTKIKSFASTPGSYGFPFQTKRGAIICHSWEKNHILEIYKNKLRLKPIKTNSKHITGPLNFFRINEKTYAVSNNDKILYSFNEDNYEFVLLPEQPVFKTQEFLRFYNVNNQLWIAGVAAGVRKLEGKNCSILSEQLYSEYFISNVYKDNEGNILLSTFNNGVLVIPDLAIEDVIKLPENQSVVSVHSDKDIGMLLGTLQGELLSFQKNKFQTVSREGKKPLQSINSWPNFPYIIYDDGQVKAYHKASGKITCLFEGSLKGGALFDSTTLFLALNSGIRKIHITASGAFENEAIESLKIRTYAIEVEPHTKNMFVATSDGLRIIKTNGTIEQPMLKGKNMFANDLFSDTQTLYVATKKEGVLCFRNGAIVQKILPKIDQTVIELYKLIVLGNKIYANSTQGFIVLDLKGNVLAKLNKIHGFSTNKIFDFEIRGEQIWIIHSRGFQKIHIKHLDVLKEKPQLEISHINVNDKPIQVTTTKGEFKSDQRKIQFTLSSPTLRNKENIRYHYKLQGYENDWLLAQYDDNQLLYNALAPGEYTFMVKAENQGVYSETKEYAFSISSPFYARWWFIILEILILLSIVTLVYRWQLRVQSKKSEQQNELNASKLTAIQSQMNPHFIFNALNSIQDLILKGDVENSYSYITTFSNMVRKTLKYSERDFIDIGQELQLLELYLSLEKLRFKKDLEYTIIKENSEDLMIPPLLIQPFIENSLVHGLLHKEGKKQLLITLHIGEICTCTIEDNGIGREKSKLIKQRQRAEHESFSGRAIQKRFEILSKTFRGNFGYVYKDLYEGPEAIGTKVTLYIPIKRKF